MIKQNNILSLMQICNVSQLLCHLALNTHTCTPTHTHTKSNLKKKEESAKSIEETYVKRISVKQKNVND